MSNPNTTQSYNTQIQYGDQATAATSNTWTKFAQVLDIKPPKIEAKDIDTTVIDQTDQFETFAPGWANAGEAEFRIQFEKTQTATVYGLFRAPKGFRIQFNDGSQPTSGSTMAFDGYVKGIQKEVQKKDLVEVTIMVKVSGKPVFTPGT